jgi:hypothetical protein
MILYKILLKKYFKKLKNKLLIISEKYDLNYEELVEKYIPKEYNN